MEEWKERPWGKHRVVSRGRGFVVKELVVYPGKRTSLQSHNNRSEVWVITEGAAKITNISKLAYEYCIKKLGEKTNKTIAYESRKGDTETICEKNIHRIEAVGDSPCVIVETWLNTSSLPDEEALIEEDIIRYEDDWGR